MTIVKANYQGRQLPPQGKAVERGGLQLTLATGTIEIELMLLPLACVRVPVRVCAAVIGI